MDRQLEESINRTMALGLQEIKLLLIENFVAGLKKDGKINDAQYSTFREVAEKHWDKQSRRLRKLARANNQDW